MNSTHYSDNTDRVRKNLSRKSNIKVEKDIISVIEKFKVQSPETIHERILEIETEWSIERKIETFASTLLLTSSVLALTKDKRWAYLTATVAVFLLQHGIQGWCPPLPLLRYFGARTRKEIDWEKFALKILRGDFAHASAQDAGLLLEKVKSL